MLRKYHIFRKFLCLILTLSLSLLPAGCGEQSEKTDSSASIGTSSETDDSANSPNEGDSSLPSTADTASPQGTESTEQILAKETKDETQDYESSNASPYPSDAEKEIISIQAEFLAKQIVIFSFHDFLNIKTPISAPNNSEIERFLQSILLFDEKEDYPYQSTYRIEQDGTCYFKKASADQIIMEVFNKTNWIPTSMNYCKETDEYFFPTGTGIGNNLDCKEFKTEFRKKDSEILLSYELWSSPYYPDVRKIGVCQSLFSIKQREDTSYYLQHIKTEKIISAE